MRLANSRNSDEVECVGDGGGEFCGEDVVDAISPSSPSLSVAESSTNIFFFLGTD